jgi:hypothetical protein
MAETLRNRVVFNLNRLMIKHKIKASPWCKKAGIGDGVIRKFMDKENGYLSFEAIEKLAAAVGEDIDAIIADNKVDPDDHTVPVTVSDGTIAHIIPADKVLEISPEMQPGTLMVIEYDSQTKIAEYDIFENAALMSDYRKDHTFGFFKGTGPEWNNGVLVKRDVESKCDIVGVVRHLTYPDIA